MASLAVQFSSFDQCSIDMLVSPYKAVFPAKWLAEIVLNWGSRSNRPR